MGNPQALRFLGAELLGRREATLPVTPDPERGLHFLRKASELGDTGADRLLRRLRRTITPTDSKA
eukprot:m.31685 g.31685  ORF g.31685 m.31685 type:complete len:65 (+) comp12353_c0_seq1:465-659(+)